MAKKKLIPEPTSPSGYRITEADSRAGLMGLASRLGCLHELKQLFEKYDRALIKCGNNPERQHISAMGIQEINKLFNFYGSVEVNGKTIVNAKSE